MSPTAQKFSATIYKIGINPCVDAPASVSQALGGRGYIPIKGTLNGFPIRATLVPVGSGRHRLYINTEMRKATSVKVGDEVQLKVTRDAEPRELPVPEALQKALDASPQAKAIFEKLPPSHRKEILTYLNWLKNPETVERNAQKVIAKLLKKAADK